MCHLDADMTREGFDALGINDLDMVFLENIGNLVCPAEFDTGAHMNLCILSVPEGDDKPIKYPLMFSVSDVVAINKIDTLPIFDFHMDRVKDAILSKNPKAEIFKISALKGIGISTLAAYLIQQYKKTIQ
jgi:hydrogenase nickel incorporation protein HypB